MARKRPEETEQTKNLILDTAKELFIQKGYGAASIEDIRIQSGMSKGSIYYHFKSKETLFVQLLERNMQEWIDKWQQMSSQAVNETERLYLLADHYALDFDNPLMKAAEEFSGNYGSDPKITERLLAITKAPYPIAAKILQDGMDNGEFQKDNVEHLTFILFATLGGLGLVYYENYSMDETIAIHRKAIDVILNGIRLH